MSPIIPIFCLCFSVGAQKPRDRWIDEDKAKHFFASFVVTSISAGAARTVGLEPAASAWVAAGVGVGAGAWKELRDRTTPGATVSLKDAAWDLAGVGAATVLVRHTR
jgi:uncharacterized protein YfiM (DUF2279 family)